jgi:hypothetical protein
MGNPGVAYGFLQAAILTQRGFDENPFARLGSELSLVTLIAWYTCAARSR